MARRLIGAMLVAVGLAAAMALTSHDVQAFFVDCNYAFCWPF